MELEIWHTTRYEFSEPVFLDPHILRFQPRADGGQLPLEFSLDVDPLPAGISASLDAPGNAATQVWFEGLHSSLTISMHAVVDMRRENPFDYLVDLSHSRLPVFYGEEADALRPYLAREPRETGGPDEVAVFAARIRDAARGELVPLLSSLNHTMQNRFRLMRREQGGPWSPERTWREKRGACRDLAVLFVDVCRALGVAARFVSGYKTPDVEDGPVDLHAWAEVYIPGAGWRGYDPSRGLATCQSHVAVAAAPTAAGTMPVIGTFRGAGVSSRIETEVRVERRVPVLA